MKVTFTICDICGKEQDSRNTNYRWSEMHSPVYFELAEDSVNVTTFKADMCSSCKSKIGNLLRDFFNKGKR